MATTLSDDAAIVQVLQAEREALAAVERGEEQARALASAARAEARRIAARADERLAAARARFAARAASESAALEDEIARVRGRSPAQAGERPRLEAAVRKLAAELAGGDG